MPPRKENVNFHALYHRLRAKNNRECNALRLRTYQPKLISCLLVIVGSAWIYHVLTSEIEVVRSDDILPPLGSIKGNLTTNDLTEDEKKRKTITQVTLITAKNVTFVLNLTQDIISLIENKMSVNFSEVLNQNLTNSVDLANMEAKENVMKKKLKKWRRRFTYPLDFNIHYMGNLTEHLLRNRTTTHNETSNTSSYNIQLQQTAFSKSLDNSYV